MCMDKTGTLTEDEVTLLKALDTDNRESTSILTLAYANSFFQVHFLPCFFVIISTSSAQAGM